LSGQRIIRGTVTAGADPAPLKGVVISAGKLNAPLAVTGADGRYMVTVSEKVTAIKFSKKGYAEKTVALTGSFIDASLEAEDIEASSAQTDTSVKTSKSGRFFSGYIHDTIDDRDAEIGYGMSQGVISSPSLKQVVSGDGMNPAFNVNINSILAGKVAGLKLYSQAEMALGRTGSISLRGPTGLSTGEGPSYYLDGTLITDISDIPYSDIESVTILTGPSSSALLGSNGRNGAVLINTSYEKTRAAGSGIILNTGFQFSTISVLPAYQDSYAGGSSFDLIKYTWIPGHPEAWKPLDGKYYHDYTDDSSWGPEMAGQEYIPWYAWYEGTAYTGKTAKLNPQPDNIRDFYNTGLRFNNSISCYKKSDRLYTSATIGSLNISGNIPYTSANKYYFSFRAKYYVTSKLSLETDLNFFTTGRSGEIDDNYSNQTTGAFNSWYHRDVETDKLKEFEDYRVPGTRILSSWNHGNPEVYAPEYPRQFYSYYWFNHYSYLKTKSIFERNDRLTGKFLLNFKINDIFSAEVGLRGEGMAWWTEEKVPQYGLSSWSGSYYGSEYYYLTGTKDYSQNNLTALLRAAKTIRSFSFDLAAGLDFCQNIIKANGTKTSEGLLIPDLYTINNSRGVPTVTNLRSAFETRSLFIRSLAGYNDMLFLDLLLRREWHSTLPPETNSIDIKSIGGTFVFSRLITIPFVDLGKIRVAWGEIPSGLKPFQYPGINYTYKINSYYWRDNNPYADWDGNYLTETPNSFADNDIRGSVKREMEMGLDLAGLRNRISFGITFWKGREEGIPVIIEVPGYSGFDRQIVNSGIIEKSGYDITIILNPFKSEKFFWQAGVVYSRLLKNDVTELGNGVTNILVESMWYSATPSMYMVEGKPWGQLCGGGMKLVDGKPLLKSDGSYISDANYNYGSVYPHITGGFQNEFRIGRNFRLNLNFDYQAGGSFFSLSQMWGTFSGLTSRTAYINDKGKPVRIPVADGGGVHVSGLDETSLREVDYYVEAQEYFHNLYNDRIFNSFVFDASYIKLRELSFSYHFAFGEKKPDPFMKGVEITLYSGNLLMIWAAQNNFDPSELSYTSGEEAQFPSVRSFGTNLRFEF
jgi:TonB-dependent SusC/RagA subfamily outer membrane receptor